MTQPILACPNSASTVVSALLATVIAIGILAAVTGLFRSEGMPMKHLVAAERACTSHTYISDRESCMRGWLAASRALSMANGPATRVK